ncbi:MULTISPECIES: hypothetical protein [unclassified Polaribacter]|uniref:hypothetical protein n=1 Tax=unclassified Polaribacter TaxID=196858 RepID=UPI00293940C5|nr:MULTISPECIES: hypothetical protein [unclassified Polaribacter]
MKLRDEISEKEALYMTKNYMKNGLEVTFIDKIEGTGKHHEYRKEIIPSYVVFYTLNKNVKAYVSIIDGKFQNVRHQG